jgi:outer membrane protein insertion porin family
MRMAKLTFNKRSIFGPLAILIFSFIFQNANAEIIRSIGVQGTHNITKATVLFNLGINLGDDCDQGLINKGIKNLYATGWFEEVAVKVEQGHLVCTLKDNPMISEVIYKGNGRIQDSLIKQVSAVLQGSFLSRESLAHDVMRIEQLYQVKGDTFLTKVTPEIDIENNKAKVTFLIAEGQKTFIKNINVIGNKAFSTDYLKSKMLSKMHPIFRIIGSNTTYNLAAFEQDKALLTNLYNSHGFLDFSVTSVVSRLSQSLNQFEVDFIVEEGTRYKLGAITIEKQDFPDAFAHKISKYLKRPKGKFCNIDAIEETARNMTRDLQEMGHYEITVKSQKSVQDDVVNVSFVPKMEEKLVMVKKINISGNVKTEEEVIRKALSFREGDYYTNASIKKSVKDLRNLDLFANAPEAITITPNFISADLAELNINVVERPTGTMNLGVEFSTGGRPQISFSASEKNFLGKGIGLGFKIGGGTNHIFLDAQMKKLVTKNTILDFGVDASYEGKAKKDNGLLSNISSQSVTSDRATKGISANAGIKNILGHGFSIHTSCSVMYEKTDQESKALDTKDDSRGRALDPGKYKAMQIQNCLSYAFKTYAEKETEATAFDCSLLHAYRQTFSKDANFHKLIANADLKIPISGKKLSLHFSTSAGAVYQPSGKRIRTQDCFSLGEENMRGFSAAGCNPYVVKAGSKYSHGGDRYYRFSAELKSSLFFPEELPVSGLLFFDCGNIWRKNKKTFDAADAIISKDLLRKSCGIGIEAEVNGALLKLSWVLWQSGAKEDKKSNFHFSMGKSF